MPLPPLLELHASGGDVAAYLDAVYARFCADFLERPRPDFDGRSFLIDRALVDGKCARFWHMITEGEVEANRIPAMRRCERIAWARHMIDNRESGEFAYWRTGTKLLIATRDFSYLVVLKGQKRVVILITTVFKESRNRRDQLRRQYEQADERFT